MNLLVQAAVLVEKALQFTVENSVLCQQLQLLHLTEHNLGCCRGHAACCCKFVQKNRVASALFQRRRHEPATRRCSAHANAGWEAKARGFDRLPAAAAAAEDGEAGDAGGHPDIRNRTDVRLGKWRQTTEGPLHWDQP
jgi:hypothetical protein